MNMKKALIVDSDRGRAAQARRVLQQAGFQTEAVGDGWSALVRLQENSPDLLLVQPLLAIVSGYEVARYTRLDPQLAGTRILMLGEASLTGAAAELADDVLALPLQPAALLQAATTARSQRPLAQTAGQYPSISSTAAS